MKLTENLELYFTRKLKIIINQTLSREGQDKICLRAGSILHFLTDSLKHRNGQKRERCFFLDGIKHRILQSRTFKCVRL